MPHVLRVGGAGQPDLAIECPRPDDLCRADRAPLDHSCMVYRPCGHTVRTEEQGWNSDDRRCNLTGDHHLWVRERELVVPTLRCSLADLMTDRRVIFFNAASNRVEVEHDVEYNLLRVFDDGTYLRLMIGGAPAMPIELPAQRGRSPVTSGTA